ncbi:Stromal cell-derived factor 2-like protein [Camellia lanceoleosa]|uniref:Stromal cell-derived factor 2-like protein n=1 Tax=Camellia lanceoleosa TaxID=1840588 RepID=A0ACC0I619_9ERIC|nr:Stromal cell-derived factor 2-like protein [Camellia lanceoleosa]
MNHPMAKEFNVPPVVFPSCGTPTPFATAAAFDGIETGLDDKPPLLKKFGINTRQIWSKTVSIVNPFRVNTNLQEYANLSVLKLMHEKTKVQLHSHEVPYGSGSKQQSVTGFSVVDDSNSYWTEVDSLYSPSYSSKTNLLISDSTARTLSEMLILTPASSSAPNSALPSTRWI